MATIGNDPNGRRRILFVAGDGTRKTIRLGKMDRKTAETCRTHVEKIMGANMGAGSLPELTYKWLAELPDTMHTRLAAVGLVNSMDFSFNDYFSSNQYDLRLMVARPVLAEILEHRVKAVRGVASAQAAMFGQVTAAYAGRDFDTLAFVLDEKNPYIGLTCLDGQPVPRDLSLELSLPWPALLSRRWFRHPLCRCMAKGETMTG